MQLFEKDVFSSFELSQQLLFCCIHFGLEFVRFLCYCFSISTLHLIALLVDFRTDDA